MGFEVVSRMGERRSLAELSRLSGESLRQEIAATLSELAGTCRLYEVKGKDALCSRFRHGFGVGSGIAGVSGVVSA